METIDQIAIKQEEAEKNGGAPVVAVEGLHKSFGNQNVLNGISLSRESRRNPGGAGPQWHW